MPKVLRFDVFDVDLSGGQLRRRGMKVSLREKSFQVLASLLERPGEVVTREELRQRLWPDDVFVDFDNNLNAAVAKLRETLGDSAEHPRFIETLPKHGYRFLAKVTEVAQVPESAPKVRLLVLPFLNLSGFPEKEYFSDAMTDEVITELARILPEQLGVIARTTAMHYKGSHEDVAWIARELNVDYVVEGSVHQADDRVRLTAQLIRTTDQVHVWARRFDTELRDVFEMQACVAEGVVEHIPAVAETARAAGALTGRGRRRPTEDLEAYNEYIRGRHEMWKWTPESVTKAKQHLEAAVARDPEFALPYDALAELCWYLGFWGFAPPRQMDLIGRGYALRAIEIDNTLAETHALLGFFPKGAYWDWARLQKDMGRARQLNAASPVVRLRWAVALMVFGRTEEAIAELEQALEFDPRSLEVRGWLAEALYLGRQYDLALEQACQLVELGPTHYLAHLVLGHAYLGMQRYEESLAALRKADELSSRSPLVLGWLGLALGLGGDKAEARALLERLRAIATQYYVPPTSFAWIHVGLGEIDDAFIWMDRAAEAHDRWLNTLRTYPFLDPYRGDPRFAALLRKMNLTS